MKNKIFNVLKLSVFVLLTLFLTYQIGKIFIPEKTSDNFQGVTYTINGYYEMPKNSIDVLFVGDSSMLWSISPMEMWHNEGIAAYNYSISAARIHTSYWLLQDALKTQKPSVVVIDPATVFNSYKLTEGQQRISMDYLKPDLFKLNMINDPIYENTFEDKVSYMLPLLRYHSRWDKIQVSDFSKIYKQYYSKTRGFVMSSELQPNYNGYSYFERDLGEKKYENNSYYYLSGIVDICKQNNIKLLILVVEDTKAWNKTQSELINTFAKEKNVDILDLNLERYGLNWLEDTRDKGIHMNVLGAMKVTKHVTNYLKTNYELKDHRGEEEYKFWDEDYKDYKNFLDLSISKVRQKIEKLNENSNS